MNNIDYYLNESIELPNINLSFVGIGKDTNGNKTMKLEYPDGKKFSIQTNGNIKSANNIGSGKAEKLGLSNDEIESISDEVVDYITNYGSKRQQTKLKVFKAKKKIKYEFEYTGGYDKQNDWELGAYIDNGIVGAVEYTIYDGVLTVRNITVLPKYRRKGIGARMVQMVKDKHPEATYVESMKTDLGAKFKHKKVKDLHHIRL